MSLSDPWLAASPDGIICDPRDSAHILGVVELKCPFSMRGRMLTEACQTATFCLEDTQNKYTLKGAGTPPARPAHAKPIKVAMED